MVDTPCGYGQPFYSTRFLKKLKRKSSDIMTTKQQFMSFTGWRFIFALRVL